MGKSSKAPAAPDPAATAAAQATANKETAIAQGQLNMVNQVTPYGNLTYEQRGTTEEGVPQYTATTALSPDQQQMLDLTNQAGIKYGQTANTQLSAVSDLLGQPLDFSGLGATPTINEDTRRQVADSMMGRLDPQFERDRAALETRLANQGIGMGSEMYNRAMDELNRAKTDARLAVDSSALGQASQLYGLEADQRNRAVNEMVQQRSIPLNELAAMLTGSQVQSPSFVNTPQASIQAPDIMGATYANYQGELSNYNQKMGQKNALMGGLFGLGSAALGGYMSNPAVFSSNPVVFAASDRRLKTGIRRIGSLGRVALYRFRYIWGGPEQVGVMADEIKAIAPRAVRRVGAFDVVNMRMVLEAL